MEFPQMLALVTVAILIAAAALFILIPNFLTSKLIASLGKNTTLSFNQAISQFKNTTQTVLVHIIPSQNTVLFSEHNVNLVVLAVNGRQAINLTGQGQAQDPVDLVISGLISPELDIPSNATIHITFVNMVSNQNCDFLITTVNPTAIANSGIQLSQNLGSVLATPLLFPANLTKGIAHVYSATVPTISQDLWYTSTCTPSQFGHIEITSS